MAMWCALLSWRGQFLLMLLSLRQAAPCCEARELLRICTFQGRLVDRAHPPQEQPSPTAPAQISTDPCLGCNGKL